MRDLALLSEEVASTILETEEYKRYKALITRLKEDPALYAKVNEMREKNFKIQYRYSDDVLDQIDALTNEYDDVINIELVGQFIEAEVSLCRLIQEFNKSIIAKLEFE